MSTREQADSVSQSRKAFKGLGGEGGGETLPSASFRTLCCWMWTRWMVIYVSSDLYCLELLHSKY